jgi:hypothetical protein
MRKAKAPALVLAAFASVAFALPAAATANISCSAADDAAVVDLVIGRLPVLGVVNGGFVIGETVYSMEGFGPNTIAVGQAFDDGRSVWVDFTDTNTERIVASLRLFTAYENELFAQAGILTMPGKGAWAVVCDEQ